MGKVQKMQFGSIMIMVGYCVGKVHNMIPW